jgi:membrane associated rhomboid family serine protease
VLFPYAIDARVTHWPYATVGLIAANALIFAAFVAGVIEIEPPWLLEFANGIHPTQWFGSAFMHGGPVHLFGNMMFLWIVGLGVEGKLGATKFLGLYLGIIALQSLLEQSLMLQYSGPAPGSLGASSVIYGVLTIAAVWTPWNNVRCFYWLGFMFTGTVDMPMLGVAALYVGMDALMTMLSAGEPSSSLLHVTGAVVGLPIGLLMLRTGRVDGEGADLLTHMGFRDVAKEKSEAERKARIEDAKQTQSTKTEALLRAARVQMHDYLKQGAGPAAYKLWTKLKDQGDGLSLAPNERIAMIRALHAASMWRESAPLMVDAITGSPKLADEFRLKLAQICVVALERPGRALELLQQTNVEALDEHQRLLSLKIAKRARDMQREGHVELDDDGW